MRFFAEPTLLSSWPATAPDRQKKHSIRHSARVVHEVSGDYRLGANLLRHHSRLDRLQSLLESLERVEYLLFLR